MAKEVIKYKLFKHYIHQVYVGKECLKVYKRRKHARKFAKR